MKIHLLSKTVCSLALFAMAFGTAKASPYMIDVDFNGSPSPAGKVGPAATGVSSTDYWNWYTRNDGQGGWLTFGALTNLQLVDNTTTSVGLTIDNFPGAWGNGSPDLMYNDYIYPWPGESGTMTFTNLPAGQYDLYAYGSDGNYEVTVGALSYGIEHTRDFPLMDPLVWTEGVQYGLFENISIAAGDDLTITCRPGQDDYAIISGLQLVAVPEPAAGALLGAGLTAAMFWRTRRRA